MCRSRCAGILQRALGAPARTMTTYAFPGVARRYKAPETLIRYSRPSVVRLHPWRVASHGVEVPLTDHDATERALRTHCAPWTYLDLLVNTTTGAARLGTSPAVLSDGPDPRIRLRRGQATIAGDGAFCDVASANSIRSISLHQ